MNWDADRSPQLFRLVRRGDLLYMVFHGSIAQAGRGFEPDRWYAAPFPAPPGYVVTVSYATAEEAEACISGDA